MIEGLVVDQIFGEQATIVETSDGRYEVSIEHKPITVFSYYEIIGNGTIILDNSRIQDNAFRLLSKAMSGLIFLKNGLTNFL